MFRENLYVPNDNAPAVKVGDTVKVPDLGIVAEVVTLADDLSGRITAVRDSKGNIYEVAELAVVAVKLGKKVYFILDWFIKLIAPLFRKRKK